MDARVKAVIKVMRESLAEQYSIPLLSKSVRLSPTRLRQIFKKTTGHPPMRCLKDLRMRHAERLLRSTFLSIKEIVFRIGLKDVSHFVRDFKKYYALRSSESRRRSTHREVWGPACVGNKPKLLSVSLFIVAGSPTRGLRRRSLASFSA